VKTFKLKTETGTEIVRIIVNQYYTTGYIHIGLECLEDDEWVSYCDLTENFVEPLPVYWGYVSDNHAFDIKKFIKRIKLGEYQEGRSKRRGGTRYFLYKFNAERLRELCPEGVREYETSKEETAEVEIIKQKEEEQLVHMKCELF